MTRADSAAACGTLQGRRLPTNGGNNRGCNDSRPGSHDQHANREEAHRRKPLDKLPAAIETGNDDGMINFNQALFNLVKAGKVSEQEALSKASNRSAGDELQGISSTKVVAYST